jgi:ribosomal-protein-alanine N-acetyltransferase
MMTMLDISAMAPRDIDAVQAIDVEAYPNPWSVATWRKELDAADRLHLVALDGDEVVGHAGLLFVLEEAHVTTVAVKPEHEGQGIASTLLVQLLAAARRHGSLSSTLEVRAADRRPQRLYSRFGFQPGGVRPGYYSAPTDDAIIMWLHDLDSDDIRDRIDRVAAEIGCPPTGTNI